MEKKQQISMRIPESDLHLLDYWADKEGMSRNEYILLAVKEKIDRANGNYDMSTLEAKRLNQLIDMYAALESEIKNLTDINLNMSKTIISLTRGDNYLLDDIDVSME